MVGDFNSKPSAPETEAPYNQMLAAGFLDTWTRRNTEPGDGPTCCQIEDLTNPVSAHTQRIDFVFVKNPSAPAGPLGGPVQIKLFGDGAEEKTSNGLWPSDHAGVFEVAAGELRASRLDSGRSGDGRRRRETGKPLSFRGSKATEESQSPALEHRDSSLRSE